MSIRSIVSSPAFLAAWVLAGVPAAAMMCHDVALAVTTGAVLPAAKLALTGVASSASLAALRLFSAATTVPSGTSLTPAPGQKLGGSA